MKATSKRICSILLALCMAMGLLVATPIMTSAANFNLVINEFDTLAAIQYDLDYYLGRARAGDTVTVTGNKTGVTGSLSLNIPAGVTVNWSAVYGGSASVMLNNSGAGDVTVSGGKVEATNGKAIVTSGDATVSGGEVTGTTGAIQAVDVVVSGGKVEASNGKAIVASGDATVSGGEVTGTTGAIQGVKVRISNTGAVEATDGIAIDASDSVTVSGGTVTGTTAAIRAVDVTISGGAVAGVAAAVVASGNVAVSGGAVVEATDGTAILASGNAMVSGGEVTGATAIIAVDVTISGGTVAGVTAAVVASGNVAVSAGNVTGDAAAIAARGNVTISGSAVVEATEAGTAILAGGDVTISGGRVTGPEFAIADDSGKITVSGGTITAAEVALATADGRIVVTGGAVSGATAVLINNYGVAAILAGTCTGDFVADNDQGLIAEVAYAADAALLGALHGTSTGLTVTGADEAKWNCSGGKTRIAFTLGDDSAAEIEWGTLFALLLSNGSVNRTSDTQATIGFNTNVDGTAYCIVLSEGAAAPSKETVRAGESAGAVTTGAASDLGVTLTAGARSIFVVVEDAAGNLSNPLKITAAAFVQKFNVTVTDGRGSGSFTPGTTVRVTAAAAPAGKVFDKWVVTDGVDLDDVNAVSTTFVMPGKDVAVAASYKDAPVVKYIFGTKYVQNRCNWLKFFLLFGWIWMWFVPPV